MLTLIAPHPFKFYVTRSRRFLRRNPSFISRSKLAVMGLGVVISGFGLLNALVFVLQLNRTPMFLQVGTTNVGLRSVAEAKQELATEPLPALILALGGKPYAIKPEEIGLRVDADATLRAATERKGLEALPLVQAYSNIRSQAPLKYAVDEKKLLVYLQGIMPTASQAAVDASIIIPPEVERPAYIVPGAQGYYFDAEAALRQIAAELEERQRFTVAIEPLTVLPKIDAVDLEQLLTQTNALLQSRIVLKSESAAFELDPGHMRQLVRISMPEAGVHTPYVDRTGLLAVLERASAVFYRAPTPTIVHKVDGNVTGTTQGTAGQRLDIEATADQFYAAVKNGDESTKVVLSAIAPPTASEGSYSPTSEGLYALIRDFAESYSGTYYVATAELTGSRAAYYNPHTPVVPASVFKVFLAYATLHKIEQGQLQFETQTSEGTVDYCIRRMIIVSVDDCAIALQQLIGYAEIDAIIHAAGFTSTRLNNSGGGHKQSTANDIAGIITSLHTGSLLSRSNADYLLGLMHQQIYRKGIPAGSSGAPVADKVGILSGWTHDAGIVYGPHSTYVLVILTSGSGFGAIKDLSQGIYDLYN